jgi:hypothetical protein
MGTLMGTYINTLGLSQLGLTENPDAGLSPKTMTIGLIPFNGIYQSIKKNQTT